MSPMTGLMAVRRAVLRSMSVVLRNSYEYLTLRLQSLSRFVV